MAGESESDVESNRQRDFLTEPCGSFFCEKKMENQHQKIKGYRDLTQEEIDLMNRIKEKGSELLALQDELANRLNTDFEVKQVAARNSQLAPNDFASPECQEFERFKAAQPQRWAAIGKTDIQTGIMALVRAVAQPTNC